MSRSSTTLLGLSRDLWYKLGGILLVALVIATIAYSLASATQASVPPTAETFAAANNKKCAANEADSYGCYPGKGEGWCAARGACINRMDTGLADDKAFAKQCDIGATTATEDAASNTASTKTVTEVDTPVTTKAVDTDTATASSANDGERTDASGGTCCLGDSGKEDTTATNAPAKCQPNAAPAAGDCTKCDNAPPSNCPKPVYCPPCPKCPPPCPRMCPDLSKYVLKTSIPPCPETHVDLDKYMLKRECKLPDMSKYVLKTSVPSFKCPPCPPCICKCDGSAYDPAVDGDGAVAREEADGTGSSGEAVSAEEALGGNRNSSQSSADFDNGNLTGKGANGDTSSASSSGASGGYDSGFGTGGSGGFGTGGSGGFGSLGGSAFGFGGGMFGRSSNGDVGANSAGADFEGSCAASDNDAYNGSYSVQPVIQND